MEATNQEDVHEDPEHVQPLADGEARYAQLKAIVESHSYSTLGFVAEGRRHEIAVDVLTAKMVTTVANALNATNRAAFLGLPLVKMVNLGWKLVK